jgi:calmodulin
MKIDVKTSEIKEMIWEVDEDIDMSINFQEFVNMYKRCVNDHDYLEPRKLFNLVQFLMFDKDFKGNIIEEQTLDLLIIRYGREDLDEQLEGIFGSEKTYGDQEMSISYKDYIEKIDKMALLHHIEMRKAKEDKSTSRKPSRK